MNSPEARRIHSRDVTELREDLAASLDCVLGANPSDEDQEKKLLVMEALTEARDAQHALRMVLIVLGPAVFGKVLRFHFEAKTSLMGHGEGLSSKKVLATLNTSIRDLQWPAKILHPKYADQAAPEDPAFEARLAGCITIWKAAHPDPLDAEEATS